MSYTKELFLALLFVFPGDVKDVWYVSCITHLLNYGNINMPYFRYMFDIFSVLSPFNQKYDPPLERCFYKDFNSVCLISRGSIPAKKIAFQKIE